MPTPSKIPPLLLRIIVYKKLIDYFCSPEMIPHLLQVKPLHSKILYASSFHTWNFFTANTLQIQYGHVAYDRI